MASYETAPYVFARADIATAARDTLNLTLGPVTQDWLITELDPVSFKMSWFDSENTEYVSFMIDELLKPYLLLH